MPLVSFDFDDTVLHCLPCPEWGSVEADEPDPVIVAAMREHAAAGDTVIIVTSRSEAFETLTQPDEWPPRTSVADCVAKHGLPVSAIHFTNGNLKAPTLVGLGVVKHFDDDTDEIDALPDSIEGVLVPEHPAWAQDDLFASGEQDDGGPNQ